MLHPCGHVQRLTDGVVIHPEVATDRANDNLARIEANANLDGDPLCSTNPLSVTLHRLLHPERSVASADAMVLVCQRRPEQRHDAIAHHPMDGALVTMDGLHHVLEYRVDELAYFLGIAVGKQVHRALQVGEKRCDLLALALDRALGNQDLLGQVLRCVGLRRREARDHRCFWHQSRRLGTLGTELCRNRQLPTTLGAHSGQRRPAFLAELRACLILVLALRAFHKSSPWREATRWFASTTSRVIGNKPVSRVVLQGICWVPTLGRIVSYGALLTHSARIAIRHPTPSPGKGRCTVPKSSPGISSSITSVPYPRCLGLHTRGLPISHNGAGSADPLRNHRQRSNTPPFR